VKDTVTISDMLSFVRPSITFLDIDHASAVRTYFVLRNVYASEVLKNFFNLHMGVGSVNTTHVIVRCLEKKSASSEGCELWPAYSMRLYFTIKSAFDIISKSTTSRENVGIRDANHFIDAFERGMREYYLKIFTYKNSSSPGIVKNIVESIRGVDALSWLRAEDENVRMTAILSMLDKIQYSHMLDGTADVNSVQRSALLYAVVDSASSIKYDVIPDIMNNATVSIRNLIRLSSNAIGQTINTVTETYNDTRTNGSDDTGGPSRVSPVHTSRQTYAATHATSASPVIKHSEGTKTHVGHVDTNPLLGRNDERFVTSSDTKNLQNMPVKNNGPTGTCITNDIKVDQFCTRVAITTRLRCKNKAIGDTGKCWAHRLVEQS
jgi:hypothetical protein